MESSINAMFNEKLSSEVSDDVQIVEYHSQMTGENPFMMGGQKFEYVWAIYPSGKRDIGVYAFSGDVVYGYDYFREWMGIK